MLFKQKTTISKGTSNTNSVRTTVPFTIAQMLELEPGDKIEWAVESNNDIISVNISKVE